MRRFADMPNLQVWYAHAELDELRAQFGAMLDRRQRKAIDKGMAKAQTRDSLQAFDKMTRVVDGRPRIAADPPLLVPLADLAPQQADATGLEEQLDPLISKYRRTLETDRRYLLEQFAFADMARKVVGVGSVGTRCWITLMLGRDETDPLFLQVKEAEPSVLSAFAGASKYTNQGQRVVAGQRLMQASSDIFLGWQRTEQGLDGRARDFYVRQLRDGKFSVDIATMVPSGLSCTASCAGGRSRGRTAVLATGSPSPPTLAAATSSTGPSRNSPAPMPTRPSATTRRSLPLPHRDASRLNAISDDHPAVLPVSTQVNSLRPGTSRGRSPTAGEVRQVRADRQLASAPNLRGHVMHLIAAASPASRTCRSHPGLWYAYGSQAGETAKNQGTARARGTAMSAEGERANGFGRLEDGLRQASDWYLWGPYVSERQWGTVREDYSADGEAWDYLPHDNARSHAYRWGEDGLAGFCDVEQRLCLGLALWNGRDPILKERAFGLTGAQANHGEDVKEYWWYLDALPSHAWNRWRYHYPQAAFPYEDLRAENGRRGKLDPEYELLDTGVFDHDRYWITEVWYAKADPTDLLMTVRVTNAGPEADIVHVLPTAWFRNTWSWDAGAPKPVMAGAGGSAVTIGHPFLGSLELLAGEGPDGTVPVPLFCENETNIKRLFGAPATTPYPKDGINDHVISGAATVNPDQHGTKCAFWYRLTVAPGDTAELRLRLRPAGAAAAHAGVGVQTEAAGVQAEAAGAHAGRPARTWGRPAFKRGRRPRSAATSTASSNSAGPKPTSSTPS